MEGTKYTQHKQSDNITCISQLAFDPKYADFQSEANTKIETHSMQEYIFQP